MDKYTEDYNDAFMNQPLYTDWVSTNKTNGGSESLVWRVIEPSTGREVSTDLEKDEAVIVEYSRELYDAVDNLFSLDDDMGDALNKIQAIYEEMTDKIQ